MHDYASYLSDQTLHEPLTINNIMKHLDQMSNQWIRVANVLELPSFVISSIQVSQLGNDQASLRRVVEWWFKNTANPEWKTIHTANPEWKTIHTANPEWKTIHTANPEWKTIHTANPEWKTIQQLQGKRAIDCVC